MKFNSNHADKLSMKHKVAKPLIFNRHSGRMVIHRDDGTVVATVYSTGEVGYRTLGEGEERKHTFMLVKDAALHVATTLPCSADEMMNVFNSVKAYLLKRD